MRRTGAPGCAIAANTSAHTVTLSMPRFRIESRVPLAQLLATFDRPALQYTHHWQVGDVIVWDNLSLQHARTAFPASQSRTLRRIQID